jgi:nucleoside transporter
MSNESFSMADRVKLSAMMFLQYMLLPVWFLPLFAYLKDLNMSATQSSWIMSSMALGCLASPLIGMVADRHFSSEKVLAVLNFLAAVLLVVAGNMTSPSMVFVILLAVMLCYMPTWGLTSAIAMAHSPSEKFPQIRVFGSIGWVASGVFSLVALYAFENKIDGTNVTFFCGAGTALLAAAAALALPHTPPPAKGQPASVVDALGLRSLSLMKDPQFAVFMMCYFLVMIPFSIYWSFFSDFLIAKGFDLVTITMNWGQVAEMFFMLAVPLVIARVGVKWAMTIGLGMLVVRYASLLLGEMYVWSPLYFLAILVHGLIFGFFFVGGQIYVDRKAPKEMKAQAQGFLFLAGFGLGLLVGNYVNGLLLDHYTNSEGAVNWQPVWTITTICSAVLFVLFMLVFHDNPKGESATADAEESTETPDPAPEG